MNGGLSSSQPAFPKSLWRRRQFRGSLLSQAESLVKLGALAEEDLVLETLHLSTSTKLGMLFLLTRP